MQANSVNASIHFAVVLPLAQSDADFISETIKARLDPVPEVQLIPIEHEGHTLLEVKVLCLLGAQQSATGSLRLGFSLAPSSTSSLPFFITLCAPTDSLLLA